MSDILSTTALSGSIKLRVKRPYVAEGMNPRTYFPHADPKLEKRCEGCGTAVLFVEGRKFPYKWRVKSQRKVTYRAAFFCDTACALGAINRCRNDRIH